MDSDLIVGRGYRGGIIVDFWHEGNEVQCRVVHSGELKPGMTLWFPGENTRYLEVSSVNTRFEQRGRELDTADILPDGRLPHDVEYQVCRDDSLGLEVSFSVSGGQMAFVEC